MIFKMLGLSYIELMRKNSAYVQNTDFFSKIFEARWHKNSFRISDRKLIMEITYNFYWKNFPLPL